MFFVIRILKLRNYLLFPQLIQRALSDYRLLFEIHFGIEGDCVGSIPRSFLMVNLWIVELTANIRCQILESDADVYIL